MNTTNAKDMKFKISLLVRQLDIYTQAGGQEHAFASGKAASGNSYGEFTVPIPVDVARQLGTMKGQMSAVATVQIGDAEPEKWHNEVLATIRLLRRQKRIANYGGCAKEAEEIEDQIHRLKNLMREDV